MNILIVCSCEPNIYWRCFHCFARHSSLLTFSFPGGLFKEYLKVVFVNNIFLRNSSQLHGSSCCCGHCRNYRGTESTVEKIMDQWNLSVSLALLFKPRKHENSMCKILLTLFPKLLLRQWWSLLGMSHHLSIRLGVFQFLKPSRQLP